MTGVEFFLWAVLGILFWNKGLHRRFPAMGYYLALRAISGPLMLLLLYEASQPGSPVRYHLLYKVYSIDFYATYLVAAVLLFFIYIEVFRAAMAPFPGIARLSVAVFPWVAFASVIVSLSSAFYAHQFPCAMGSIVCGVERAVGVLSLCLLVFLCLSMKALRLSVRDLSFGITLGFGVMSSGDFVMASWASHIKSLSDPVEFVYESLILAALAVWTTYSILPEPARKPILVPANSTIYRWNEIATALGHTGTRVVVQQPANGFFLSDVERVVEKALARNMKDRKSET